MRQKSAVGVEREEITPTPPTSGVPIKPPVFPNLPPAAPGPVKPKKPPVPTKIPKPVGAVGLEAPISDAVKEALELLKQIVEQGTEVLTSVEETSKTNTESISDLKVNLADMIDSLSNVETIAKDIQKMRVPERVQYESNQEYEDSLYNQIIGILDKTISQLEGVFPDYQYNKSTITRFDEEGNILNGELRLSIVLSNFISKRRYHIEIPVYIFNGYLQHPDLFIFEGQNYPFTSEELKELISYEPTYPKFEDGAHWFGQNKGILKHEPKVPGKYHQKEYKKFDKRLNPVQPKPRFWHNYSSVDQFPTLDNITSTPVNYQDIDYALY